MDTQELIEQSRAVRGRIGAYGRQNHPYEGSRGEGAKAQVCEFLRRYAGPRSAFVEEAEKSGGNDKFMVTNLTAIMDSFIEYIQAGLPLGISPERKGQLDVVSDILEQASTILEDKGYHPAAAAMLTGAALEEFLRTWVEAEDISIDNAKPGIDAYAKALRAAELISKQDAKDITSWAGCRNHAAHGEWEEVSDPARIRIMLEGVNLFMRQKGP